MIEKWAIHNKENNIDEILKKLINNPQLALDDADVRWVLKGNRRFGRKLREMYYVFDETHKAPKYLAKATKSHGKLNDAIISKNLNKIKEFA